MKYNTSDNIDRQKAEVRFKKLVEDGKLIELKAVREKRTISQNGYIHVCISLFAIEFGYTLKEAKTLLKRECHFMMYQKNDKWFLRSTAELDTKEMATFTDWVRNYSAKEGCYICSPEEYEQNRTSIDREINSHKEHL